MSYFKSNVSSEKKLLTSQEFYFDPISIKISSMSNINIVGYFFYEKAHSAFWVCHFGTRNKKARQKDLWPRSIKKNNYSRRDRLCSLLSFVP